MTEGQEEIMEETLKEEQVQEEPQDGDEEIFPEGPTRNKIEEWKSRYGTIYMVEIEDEVFVFRTITRIEYKEILKAKEADALYREERMCEKCVLWPDRYSFINMSQGKAGIPSLLAEQIMDKSGFSPSSAPQKL